LITLTGTDAVSRLSISGSPVLADDLVVTQSNPNSTQTGGAISLSTFSGTGNITFNNVMNDLTSGLINFSSNLGSTGTLTIASGAVRGQGAAPFNAANAIKLGVTGGSSASLLAYRAGNQTIANGITVAAVGSGNRAVLGQTSPNNTTGVTTFSGTMTLNGGLTVTSQTAQTAGTNLGVVLSGELSGAGGLFINGTFKNSGADLTTTGAVKVSNANNTFSGNTRIAAGTLYVTNATALKNSTVDLNASDAGTLAFGSTTTAGLASATFGGLSGSRNLVLQDTLTSPGAVALSIGNNNANSSYSGNLSGSGSLIKIGTGTQTLSGTNTYAGVTTLTTGTLVFANTSAKSSSSTVTAAAAGTVGLGVGGAGYYSATDVADLFNTNTLSGFSMNSASGVAIDTTNATSGTFEQSTALTGTRALTKLGTGKLVLSGTNTYTGATSVTSGVLAVNGSLASTSTTVGTGATLQGSGSIGGSVTVQGGGTLATGNSIESLTTGALSLQALSTFAYEINNDAAANVAGDLTAVTGNLALDLGNAAILTLTDLGSGSWSVGEKLTLISYSGAWNNGLFNYASGTLADDSTFTFSGMDWAFNYNDTVAGTNYTGDLIGSSFVTMTAIPEPNVAALLGSLGTLALLRRRR
jgi:autotransporter-associated beta strand protein